MNTGLCLLIQIIDFVQESVRTPDAGAAYDLDEPEQTDTEKTDENDEKSTDDRFLRKRRRKKVRNGGM